MSLSASLAAVMHATTDMTQYCQVRTLHMAFAKKEELPPGPSILSATTLTLHLEDLSLLSPQDTMDHSIMTKAIISILHPHAPMFPHLTTLTLETISVPDLVQLSQHCPLLERLTIAFPDWKSDIDKADLVSFPNLNLLGFHFNSAAGYIGLSKVLASCPKITKLNLTDRMVIRGRLPRPLSTPPLKHLKLRMLMPTRREEFLADTLLDLGLTSLERLEVERDQLEQDCDDLPSVSACAPNWIFLRDSTFNGQVAGAMRETIGEPAIGPTALESFLLSLEMAYTSHSRLGRDTRPFYRRHTQKASQFGAFLLLGRTASLSTRNFP
jgi:hypothetical protein